MNVKSMTNIFLHHLELLASCSLEILDTNRKTFLFVLTDCFEVLHPKLLMLESLSKYGKIDFQDRCQKIVKCF